MNKNQARIRRTLHKEKSVNEQVPTHGYHNSPKGAWIGRTFSLVKYIAKKKAKPFPKVNDGPSLMEQRKFLGYIC